MAKMWTADVHKELRARMNGETFVVGSEAIHWAGLLGEAMDCIEEATGLLRTAADQLPQIDDFIARMEGIGDYG